MHDLHGWAPQATQVSNQWRQDEHPPLIAGAKVSAGLSPAGSWDHQTGMFSPDTGLMRPSRNVLWTPCRDAQGLTSKWTLRVYWSGLWSVTTGIEQEYPNRPSCDIGTNQFIVRTHAGAV